MSTPEVICEDCGQPIRLHTCPPPGATGGRTPFKPASPSGTLAVTTGSLPVSSVQAILTRWTTDEQRRRAKSADTHKVAQWARERYDAEADILAGCIADLRAEMAAATSRRSLGRARSPHRNTSLGASPYRVN